MKQSIYTQISKRIGWQGTATIPSIAEAAQLRDMVKRSDEYAFEKVFKIHRFATTATTLEQNTAMNIIYEAYNIGTQIFKDVEATV